MESRSVDAKGRGKIDEDFGVGRGKLLHLEKISNEVLLYTAQGTISTLLG